MKRSGNELKSGLKAAQNRGKLKIRSKGCVDTGKQASLRIELRAGSFAETSVCKVQRLHTLSSNAVKALASCRRTVKLVRGFYCQTYACFLPESSSFDRVKKDPISSVNAGRRKASQQGGDEESWRTEVRYQALILLTWEDSGKNELLSFLHVESFCWRAKPQQFWILRNMGQLAFPQPCRN